VEAEQDLMVEVEVEQEVIELLVMDLHLCKDHH
jgi:hypothetical protein